MIKSIIINGAALIILTGCASINQSVSTQLTNTNGVVEVRTTTSRVIALMDSKNVIEKLRVSNGKTQGIGLTGTENEASSTNLVQALREIGNIISLLK